MASTKAADDHVDAVGQQFGKTRDTFLASNLEKSGDEDDRRCHGGYERADPISKHKSEDHKQQHTQCDRGNDEKVPVHAQAGLRHKFVPASQNRVMELSEATLDPSRVERFVRVGAKLA